ncbi:MAG: SUMF1/EgtB/PvdO family nonheme iron enzyme [Muribaculaceae bacterium]|nr:SUMF1/EgtB/PvdO family nonheme iron enzyme [Muribaculaceae bacterium]
MKRIPFFSHLAAFACGIMLVSGVSLTAPHRVSSGVYGDVNGDGTVDVDDLNEVINVILGKPHGGATTKTYTVGGVSFKMVAVEGGTFTMGATAEQGDDAWDWEKPAHQVTLSSYSIGETEVTQALWQAVMGSNPSWFNGSREEYDYDSDQYVTVNYGTNLQRPVECVNWDECQTFITKLNQLTGETFRLPTEAEWEYAARGGNKSQGYKYAGSKTVGDVAWCWDNIPSQSTGTSGYGTQMVATKSPNELGLYDMSGNVFEWCQDWYGSYSSGAQTNPQGPSSGSYCVNRGGGWRNDAGNCRVSYRGFNAPSIAGLSLGLRLAF